MACDPPSTRLQRSALRFPTQFPRRRSCQRSFFRGDGRPFDSRWFVRRAYGGSLFAAAFWEASRVGSRGGGACCRTWGARQTLPAYRSLQRTQSWLFPLTLQFWEEQHPSGPRQLPWDWEPLAA